MLTIAILAASLASTAMASQTKSNKKEAKAAKAWLNKEVEKHFEALIIKTNRDVWIDYDLGVKKMIDKSEKEIWVSTSIKEMVKGNFNLHKENVACSRDEFNNYLNVFAERGGFGEICRQFLTGSEGAEFNLKQAFKEMRATNAFLELFQSDKKSILDFMKIIVEGFRLLAWKREKHYVELYAWNKIEAHIELIKRNLHESMFCPAEQRLTKLAGLAHIEVGFDILNKILGEDDDDAQSIQGLIIMHFKLDKSSVEETEMLRLCTKIREELAKLAKKKTPLTLRRVVPVAAKAIMENNPQSQLVILDRLVEDLCYFYYACALEGMWRDRDAKNIIRRYVHRKVQVDVEEDLICEETLTKMFECMTSRCHGTLGQALNITMPFNAISMDESLQSQITTRITMTHDVAAVTARKNAKLDEMARKQYEKVDNHDVEEYGNKVRRRRLLRKPYPRGLKAAREAFENNIRRRRRR